MSKIKHIRAITLALLLLSTTGCSINKAQYSEYLRMQADYNKISYKYAVDYSETIMFIANYKELSKGELDDTLAKCTSKLSQNILNTFNNSAEQDLTNSGLTPANEAFPDDIGVDNGKYIAPETYPIYGRHLAIERYGTHAEYLAALQELKNMTTNSIVSVDKYKDYIVARMDNKNTGEYLMTFTLKDGKIDSYTTYWR